MALLHASSPHVRYKNQTTYVMCSVLLALVPGTLALIAFFGWGSLIQILWLCSLGATLEAICLKLRDRSLGFYLKDGSVIVTACLLAVAIPPTAPWWVGMVGMVAAVVFAKHLYGGMGQNPFNPAMVAYALLLVSFPVEMTRWLSPFVMNSEGSWNVLGFTATAAEIFQLGNAGLLDSFTGATPLDIMKHRGMTTTEEVWLSSSVLSQGIGAWYAVSAGFLMGGIYLIYKKIFTWHTPLSLLVSLFLIATLFTAFSPDEYVSPLFHLSVGGTMLAAFFIATDPVTSATSNRGKLVYGASIGLLIYIIRTWGGYPDGVAFAVLLMNLAAPFIDIYTQPRSFGHARAKRGIAGKGDNG